MPGISSPPAPVDEKARENAEVMDQAFSRAEASIVDMGKAVAERIAIEFKARRIGSKGIDQRIKLALQQAATAAGPAVPHYTAKLLLETLHRTIVDELASHGIVWEAPTS